MINEENENGEKINIMFEKLSDKRMNRIREMIGQTIDTLYSKKVKKDIAFNVEITEKFDKEEKHQFVWVKLSITLRNVQTNNPILDKFGTNAAEVNILDAEVYEENNIDHWLDHVKRINEGQHMYLKNDDNVSQDNMNQNELTEDLTDSIEREMEEEDIINEQRFIFMGLFKDSFPHKKNKEEYKTIFFMYTSTFANRIMNAYMNFDPDNSELMVNLIVESYSILTSNFTMCDFTEFSKVELEVFGFVNWRNKMLMIPVWAFPIILRNNTGLVVHDIHGELHIVGKDFIPTNDNKNGSMSVGIPIKNEKDGFTPIFEHKN